MSCLKAARALALGSMVAAFAGAALAANTASIQTLSSHPDKVTGEDSLVRVDVPSNVALQNVMVKLNGANVTSMFQADATAHALIGLVTGLAEGPNALQVYTNGNGAGRPSAQVTLVDHPLEGPLFTGPPQQPFICQTESFRLPDGTTLGPPLDPETCFVPTRVQYVYLPAGGTSFQPVPDTSTLPSDVATVTTDAGVTMPFVVRVETGVMDRGIYQNAILHDPTTEPAPTPFTPPKGWNHRLQGLHGSGCTGGWYIQGSRMGENILDPVLLGRGFGMFINTLNHPTNSCSQFLAGEVTAMGKEHFIEEFGVPYYTVSRGCSGGAYSSEVVSDTFPGLFDGILFDCTFPDPFSIAFSGQDGHLLTHYFAVTNPTGFTPEQQAAVSGYANTTTLLAAANQSGRTDPVPSRADVPGYRSAVWNAAVPTSLRYDPVTNPDGARPTVFDWNANVFGEDPATGFALRTFDNVGVQYGLAALNAGVITKAQFIDLNARIGGYDQDENYVPQRTVGDVDAMRRQYASGVQLSGGGGMSQIPVFDFTGIYSEDTTNYHLQWEHFATRERMKEMNGDTLNHVMWRGDVDLDDQARAVFDQWMEAYKADTSNRPQRDKVIASKPAAATDGCWSDPATFIAEPQTFSSQPNTTCNALLPSFAFPRYIAGGPLSASKMKCELKPVDASDYTVAFTADELAQLRAIFPGGVCDWSKPGVNQIKVYDWPTVPTVGVVDLSPCVNPADDAAADARCTPPLEVRLVPDVLNLRTSQGLVTAVITAAPGYDLRQWSIDDVKLGNAGALSGALSANGQTYVATFRKSGLTGLSAGVATLAVNGTLQRNGNEGQFVAATTATVLH
jgi:hypothetical protein